jgi:hypothetical protein
MLWVSHYTITKGLTVFLRVPLGFGLVGTVEFILIIFLVIVKFNSYLWVYIVEPFPAVMLWVSHFNITKGLTVFLRVPSGFGW